MSVLDIKNLNVSFYLEDGIYRAIDNVSLSIKKGSTHALVGESGCGKSITAMSILNLLPKTAKITGGNIIFEEKDLLTLSQEKIQEVRGSKIALIPQDPLTSLNPLYTIGNQLLEIIELHQHLEKDNAKEKAIEALNMVKIPAPERCFNSYPHELSGGMKQRAIIAMALACNAKLIIADEPTTALDVTIQIQIMNLLEEIKKEYGTSILLISHDLALVSQYADEISVMYSGKIVEHAPVREFFLTTNHPYSTALIRALPSNKFKKLASIKGQPPTLKQHIQGCKFHPRCSYCLPQVCNTQVPELKEIGMNHFSACHLN
ncbi:ABC transporter ATP-binding protein [bacterium]|nr:ABC transporter ATP-binding protein [bacterium]